jgi:hypothetical protein
MLPIVVLQVIGFLTNLVSRRFEYQADRYVTWPSSAGQTPRCVCTFHAACTTIKALLSEPYCAVKQFSLQAAEHCCLHAKKPAAVPVTGW